jgi:hypothetical protein
MIGDKDTYVIKGKLSKEEIKDIITETKELSMSFNSSPQNFAKFLDECTDESVLQLRILISLDTIVDIRDLLIKEPLLKYRAYLYAIKDYNLSSKTGEISRFKF